MTETAPDLQRYGGVVILQGEALRLVQFLATIGARKRAAETRRDSTPYVRQVLAEIDAATLCTQGQRHDDVAVTPIPATYLIDSEAAAEILGCSRRHVQRIARSLDGQRTGTGAGAWQFDRRTVATYRRGGAAA